MKNSKEMTTTKVRSDYFEGERGGFQWGRAPQEFVGASNILFLDPGVTYMGVLTLSLSFLIWVFSW